MFPENTNTNTTSGRTGNLNPNPQETANALLSFNIPLQTLPDNNNNNSPPPTKIIPHPDFYRIQTHLSHPLVPLVSITTGLPHPSFPTTILQFNLLTSAQLDELAVHYHQTRPATRETFGYPIRVRSWVGGDVSIETKRRRWGRFIGLRGCESPVGEGGDGQEVIEMESEEEMLARMEREWQEALRRARSEDDEMLLRWKAGGI